MGTMRPGVKAEALDWAIEAAEAMPRLPMSQACMDPAFLACLDEALRTPELVEQFDRLYGASLSAGRSHIERMVDKATGKLDEDVAAFAKFVHDCVYMRIPNEAIGALRLTGMSQVVEDL